MSKLNLFVLLGAVLCSGAVNARLAAIKDLPVIYERYHAKIDIDRSAHRTSTEVLLYRVLNDEGRLAISRWNVDFDSNSSSVKLIKAYTITHGKRYPVNKSDIQLQDIPGSPLGFDRLRRLVVNFPEVEVGSQIYIKYRIHHFLNEIPHFVSIGENLVGLTELDYNVQIHSQIPLYSYIYDPKHVLQMTKTHPAPKGAFYNVTIHSLRPILNVPVDEKYTMIEAKRVPQWLVSSQNDWHHFALNTIAKYEKIINAPLPAAFAKIRDDAKKEKSTVGKLNKITAELADQVRYFGDWQRRHGAIIPRSLATIAKTGYGDCKDFAVSVTAIARSLGLHANVAWIMRGGLALPQAPYRLPSQTGFNHAIARIQDGKRVYWVDGTNETSWAQGIPQDIENRPAFVLDGRHPFLDHTPARTDHDSEVDLALTYRKAGHGHMKVTGTAGLHGASANSLVSQLFSYSQQMVDYSVVSQLTNGIPLLNWKVTAGEGAVRIPHDETLHIKYELGDTGFRTTTGIGFPAPEVEVVRHLLVNLKDRYGDLHLPLPEVENFKTTLNDLDIKGDRSLDCKITSPWVDLSRKLVKHSGSVVLSDHYKIKTRYIPIQELLSPRFHEFQTKVRHCFSRVELILADGDAASI